MNGAKQEIAAMTNPNMEQGSLPMLSAARMCSSACPLRRADAGHDPHDEP